MQTEMRINLLKARVQLLNARGPHNLKLVQKLKRKIRALGGEV